MTLVEDVAHAIKAKWKFVAINCDDQEHVTELLSPLSVCLYRWSIVTGLVPDTNKNDMTRRACIKVDKNIVNMPDGLLMRTQNLTEALPFVREASVHLSRMAEKKENDANDDDDEDNEPSEKEMRQRGLSFECYIPALVFIHDAHKFLSSEAVALFAIIRDYCHAKVSTTCLYVLLGQSFKLPPEVSPYIAVFSHDGCTDEELSKVVTSPFNEYKLPPTKKARDTIQASVEILRGLPRNAARQAVAFSQTKGTCDTLKLMDQKRALLANSVPGLNFRPARYTFNDVGGLAQAKKFSHALFGGPEAPSCIMLLDEIEKMMAGATGSASDSSGVSQDAFGCLLQWIQNEKVAGQMAVGVPGCAKSLYAEALAGTFNIPFVHFDLGATRNRFVGESEANIRRALAVLTRIGGSSVYLVATSNDLSRIPNEMQRRFAFGTWFFDLPDHDERLLIWKLASKLFPSGAWLKYPDDEGWTGAEIMNCAQLSWRLGISPKEAAAYISPLIESNPQGVEQLRRSAHKRYLSASHSGNYVYPPIAREEQAAQLAQLPQQPKQNGLFSWRRTA